MDDSSESFEYIGCYKNNPRVPGFSDWNPNNLINNPKRNDVCAKQALSHNKEYYGLENNNGCLIFDQKDMERMQPNQITGVPESNCKIPFRVAIHKKADPEIVVEKEAARAPPAPSVLYKCNNYTCQQDPNGNYSSLAECNNDCKPSFVCNRPEDGFPSCQETQTLANQLKSAQDKFNDAKSRMEKIPRNSSCPANYYLHEQDNADDFLNENFIDSSDKMLSFNNAETAGSWCDKEVECKGLLIEDGRYTDSFSGLKYFPRKGLGVKGSAGTGFWKNRPYSFCLPTAADEKLSLYQNTIDSINNKVKQGDNNNYFDSLKSCQSSCKPKFNCDMDTLTVFPAADGSYNSIEEAENNCKPRFSCDTENWVVRMDPRGKYKDINLASMNCQPPLIVPKTKITQKDVEKENNIKANVEGQLKSDTLRLESDYLHMLVWGALAILFIYMVFYYSTNNTNSVLQNLIIIVVLIALIWTISVALWNYFKNNPIKFTEGPIMY